jgi:hypothetical protein
MTELEGFPHSSKHKVGGVRHFIYLSKVWTLFSGLGGMGVDLSHFPGYLWFFTEIKTSSRHLAARPKVDLAVLVDIPGHLSHIR